MDDYRSKSMHHQIETYRHSNGGVEPTSFNNGMQDLRCYSASYASSVVTQMGNSNNNPNPNPKPNISDLKFKKGKSTNGSNNSWSLSDPELQRKRRVASYKVYSVEGKVKGSFKKSFRWFKDRCARIVYGW